MCPASRWHLKIESWKQGPTTKTQYIAQADCQPAGCKSTIKFEFPKSKANIIKNSWNNFGLYFLHDQTKTACHKWSTTYGGCPYASSVMHKSLKNEMFSIDNRGKIYTRFTDSHPSGTWLIFRSYIRIVPVEVDRLNSLGNTILQNEATLTNQLGPSSNNNNPQPFSWLMLVQQGVNTLSLTEAINFTSCFICASLNEPPLAAVPLQTRFNLSQSSTGPDTTLTGIPLFKTHSQGLFFCYGMTNSSSCNTTVKVRSTHHAPPGGYFWCNGTLTKVINASLPSPSVPVTLGPQLKVYGQAQFLSFLMPPPARRNKRAVFLPIVVGLSLASSLVAAGIGSGAMGYSVTSAAQLEDKLCVAIEASAASLPSLQRQITSLAQVTLQNRRPLDLLTAEKGGTCFSRRSAAITSMNQA
nr:endogenous retrovirus group FC1 Env polyprotein-like [Aotus nancymaae]